MLWFSEPLRTRPALGVIDEDVLLDGESAEDGRATPYAYGSVTKIDWCDADGGRVLPVLL